MAELAGDQPVRGGEGQVLLTHLPLQPQAAPATAVPIAAGEGARERVA